MLELWIFIQGLKLKTSAKIFWVNKLDMPTPERLEKITRVASLRQEGVLVLEDIYDPHNAEAVLRSCDAFAFQRVCFIFDKQKPFNPRKVGKTSSSSANKWLDFEIFNSTKECLESLKSDGYEIIATVLEEDSENLYESDLSNPKIALMLGNESRGLSKEAVEMSDRKIMIPMKGMVQSLNLSVTASVFLFEINRQRASLEQGDYALTQSKKEALITSFSDR